MSLVGNILGIRMNLLIGPSPVALPAPREFLTAIDEIEIKLSDSEASGFMLTVNTGRSGPFDFLEAPFVSDPRFAVGARVIVTMIFDFTQQVIFDGLVTKKHYRPGGEARSGKLILMGRDLSFELDKEVKCKQHPGMDETAIASLIALQYPQFGMMPGAMPPKVIDPALPIDRVPQQRCSDWAYLNQMAKRHGYETYVDPGPVPGTNMLYWGPPVRPGVPQRTITVDSGPNSDAWNVEVEHNGEELTTVESKVLDRLTGAETPALALVSSQQPLGAIPESVARFGQTRKQPIETSGLNMAQAMARAQAKVDESARNSFRVRGTLNSTMYNAALKARDRVFLRGAGLSYGGEYKVAEVRHLIRPGSYEQGFVLRRSESGPMLPMVLP